MESPNEKPWFYRPVWTADQAAEFLNLSPQSIYKMRDDGVIPQLEKLPGVRFRKKDVMALAELGDDVIKPFEVAQYKLEIKGLKKEVNRLRDLLQGIVQTAEKGVAV